MEPDFMLYQGRLVLQVPIEWRYSRFCALMDGDKLVALVGPHELPESYDFLSDLRGDEQAIASLARKQVGEYTMKVATAAAKAAAEKLATVVSYEGKSVLQVPIDCCDNRFVAIADVNLLALIPQGASLSACHDQRDLIHESFVREEVLKKLAVKPCIGLKVEAAVRSHPEQQPPSSISAPPQQQTQNANVPEPVKPEELRSTLRRLLRVVWPDAALRHQHPEGQTSEAKQ